MIFRKLSILCLLLGVVFNCSCAQQRDYGKQTFPVSGTVTVDGAPVASVQVSLHTVSNLDDPNPTFSSAFTKEDGTFELSTFEEGDGVPAGNYVATFSWGEFNVISRTMSGDKLNGRYSDPAKSSFKVTVSEGQPTEMGRIELTTK